MTEGRRRGGPARAIVNGASAEKLRDVDWLDALRTTFGIEPTMTRGPEDAIDLARAAAAAGCPLLLVAGGDGTVNQVVNGLGPRAGGTALGIIPIGTGNDLATALGVPGDPGEAVLALADAATVTLDLIRVAWDGGERLAANACTAGFSARVDENLSDRSKELLGGLAYMLSAGASLPELEPHRLVAEVDGETLEAEAFNVVVANGPTLGGGVRVAPEARLDDGSLELLVVPRLPLAQLALLVPRIVLGEHLGDERLILRSVKRIVLRADPPMRLTADGDVVGETPASLEVVPGALTVLSPGA